MEPEVNSDGSLSNLPLWESVLKIKLKWHFFATSHGKGVMDGLGGSIKRSVWGIICSQDHTISNASEYADLARQRNPNIDILYITKSKVEENKHFLEDRFANVRSYSGFSQMHCFKYYGIHHPYVRDFRLYRIYCCKSLY